MTYATISALLFGQKPIWLYEFTKDAVITRFTSTDDDYTWNSETWTASSIAHGKIVQSSDPDRIELPITFPVSDTFAQGYLAPVSASSTTLKIYRGFANDGAQEFLVRYVGRIIAAKPDDKNITLLVEDEMSTTRRKGLSAVMQRPCRHAHYGLGCGLVLATAQLAATATAVSGRVVTVTEASLQVDTFYAAGIFEFNGATEMIEKHVGDQVTLVSIMPGLEAEISGMGTASVTIARGCNLTMEICNEQSNLDNHGGFPWMSDNPFDGRSII